MFSAQRGDVKLRSDYPLRQRFLICITLDMCTVSSQRDPAVRHVFLGINQIEELGLAQID